MSRLSIFDLDDTLVGGHLYLARMRGVRLRPNPEVLDRFVDRSQDPAESVAIVTGRSARDRDDTVAWLHRYAGAAFRPSTPIRFGGDFPGGWLAGKLHAAVELVRDLAPDSVEVYDDDARVLAGNAETLAPLCRDLRLYRVEDGSIRLWK